MLPPLHSDGGSTRYFPSPARSPGLSPPPEKKPARSQEPRGHSLPPAATNSLTVLRKTHTLSRGPPPCPRGPPGLLSGPRLLAFSLSLSPLCSGAPLRGLAHKTPPSRLPTESPLAPLPPCAPEDCPERSEIGGSLGSWGRGAGAGVARAGQRAGLSWGGPGSQAQLHL